MPDALDQQCIDTLRFLSVDMVQKADSGHPGLPLGAAPMAYVLWTRFLKHHPADPHWADRETYGRFVVTLTAHSTVLTRFNGGDGQIAIHGSGSLGRVGRASSHGCIILGDAALTTVFRAVEPGTPVIVTR